MSGKIEHMISDAIIFGTRFYGPSYQDVIEYGERMNPYSWSIKYFDDWRCVADYLREIAEDNTNDPHNNIPE